MRKRTSSPFPLFLAMLPNLSPHCNLLFIFCWVCMHEKGSEALRSLLTKGKSELFGFCMCCIPAPLMIVIELAKYTPKNFLKMTARGFLSNRPASILASPWQCQPQRNPTARPLCFQSPSEPWWHLLWKNLPHSWSQKSIKRQDGISFDEDETATEGGRIKGWLCTGCWIRLVLLSNRLVIIVHWA